MKTRVVLVCFFALFLLPMPFVWFGYGEKGYIGCTMLGNPLLLGGVCLLLLSRRLEQKGHPCCRIWGSLLLLCSYAWGALDFCGHLPMGIHPLLICKLPMWISLLGAMGLMAYAKG